LLEDLAPEGPLIPLDRALALASTQAPVAAKSALESLVEAAFSWRSPSGRLPVPNGEYEKIDRSMAQALRSRIRHLVLTADVLPDPRDVVILVSWRRAG